jgi:hypothetical protein
MIEMLPKLLPSERARLNELEAIIEHGIAAYVRSGNALREVRDSRLYRESHAKFEDYCRVRWRLGRSTSYQLIDAAEVVERLSAIADTKDVTPTSDPPIPLPATESVARELVPLKQQPEAFPMNLRTGGGHAPEYVCENHFEEAASETLRGREPMVPSVPRSGPKVNGRATGYEKPRNEHRTPRDAPLDESDALSYRLCCRARGRLSVVLALPIR